MDENKEVRKEFQEVIVEIIKNNGKENEFDLEVGNEFIKLEDEILMDLVIERVRENQLAVAHTKKVNYDIIRDPEIVFDIGKEPWLPVSYEMSGIEYKKDMENGLELNEILSGWKINLEDCKFTDKTEGLVH